MVLLASRSIQSMVVSALLCCVACATLEKALALMVGLDLGCSKNATRFRVSAVVVQLLAELFVSKSGQDVARSI